MTIDYINLKANKSNIINISKLLITLLNCKCLTNNLIISKLKINKDNEKKIILCLYLLIGLKEIYELIKNKNNSIIRHNFYRIIDLLLIFNIDINYIFNNNDYNLLMLAISNNYNTIIKKLINIYCININYKVSNSEYCNALMLSIKYNNMLAFKLLIENDDLNINEVNNLGKTALFYTVLKTKNKSINYYSKNLINKGININHCDNFNLSVINYAIKEQNITLIKYLINTGNIDIDYINNNKLIFNLLDLKLYDSIYKLINLGLDINIINDNNEDILYYSIKIKNVYFCKYILNNYPLFDIDRTYKNGESLLTLAIKNNLFEIVIKLIQSNINLYIINNYGETSFSLAKKSSYYNIYINEMKKQIINTPINKENIINDDISNMQIEDINQFLSDYADLIIELYE